MKYVLDSSAALPWVLPEKDSAKAIQLRDDARNAIHELLAPDIFPAEVLNAFLKAERTKRSLSRRRRAVRLDDSQGPATRPSHYGGAGLLILAER